jgi:hypothetical protein
MYIYIYIYIERERERERGKGILFSHKKGIMLCHCRKTDGSADHVK